MAQHYRVLVTFIAIILSGALRSYSQSSLSIIRPIYKWYRSENNTLPTNTVYRIDEGKDGYLWITADQGLYRYDGLSFVPMPNDIHDNLVGNFKTSDGFLILFLYSGATRGIDLSSHRMINTDSLWQLSKLKAGVRPYLFGFESEGKLILVKKSQSDDSIMGTIIDRRTGKSRFACVSRELNINWHQYGISDSTVAQTFLKWRLNACHLQYNDRIVILDNKIMDRYQKKILFDGTANLPGSIITAAEKDDHGLWVGTLDKGLLYYSDTLPPARTRIPTPTLEYPISSILRDYIGNIWVATLTSGIFQFRKKDRGAGYIESDIPSRDNPNYQLGKQRAFTLLNDNSYSGFVFESTKAKKTKKQNAGKYLVQSSYSNFELTLSNTHFQELLSQTPPEILPCLTQNRITYPWKDFYKIHDTIIISSLESVVRLRPHSPPLIFDLSNQFHIQNAMSGLPLSDSTCLIGTARGLFLNSRKLPWLEQSFINKIRKDREEILLCTTDGVFILTEENLQAKRAPLRISETHFIDVCMDSSYYYFLGKQQIACYEKSSRRKISALSISNYTIPFTAQNCFTDKDHLIIAAGRGLFFIPKNTIRRTSLPAPKIYIASSYVTSKAGENSLQIRFEKNFRTSFKIDLLNYSEEPCKIIYKFMKDGEDYSGWNTYTSNSEIYFYQHPPGNYRLMVHAKSLEGLWEVKTNFDIQISPTWWQTRWFKILAFFVGLGCMTLFIIVVLKVIRSRQMKQIEIKLKQNELELQSLNAQINPHFIYNALIPFQDYTLHGESERALSYIRKFSRLMRGLFHNTRYKTVTIAEEIEFLSSYLDIQKQRFNDAFEYSMTMDQDIDLSMHIPTLFIQPIVENAVEHGVNKITHKGLIELAFHINPDTQSLSVHVRDNGKGFLLPFSPLKGHVLEVIVERLRLLEQSGSNASIQFLNRKPTGAEVILSLPTSLKKK